MPLTPEEQNRLDDLRLKALRAKAAGAIPAPPARDHSKDPTPGRLGPDSRQVDAPSVTSKAAAGSVFNVILPTAASFAGPLASGAAGAGGEFVRQQIVGEDKPGEIAKQGIINLMPFAKAGGAIRRTLANMGRQGAAGLAGEETRSVIDEGRAASTGDAAMASGVPMAASAISPIMGRVLGAITKRVDPAEVARVAREKLNNAEKDKTLAAMRARGPVAVVPSSVNPSLKNRLLESIAGIQNVEAGVARENAPTFNAIGRSEAELAPDVSINADNLRAARAEIAKPIVDAEALGFRAEADRWRDAIAKARDARADIIPGNRAAGRVAAELAEKEEADALKDLTAKLLAAGRKDIADALPDINKRWAKNYDVREATPTGTDNISPALLANMERAREEGGLSAGLLDLVRFQNAFGRSAKNIDRVATAPGAASAGTSLIAGGGDPVTTAGLLGGVPLVRGKIRDHLVSPAYQAANAQRNYTPRTSADPKMVAAIIAAIRQAQASGAAANRE